MLIVIFENEQPAFPEEPYLDPPLILDILGKNYKPKQRHRMAPDIKPTINNLQCVAFSSLPFSELAVIEEAKMPTVLVQAMAARQQQARILSPGADQRRPPRRQGGNSPGFKAFTQTRLLPAISWAKMNRQK